MASWFSAAFRGLSFSPNTSPAISVSLRWKSSVASASTCLIRSASSPELSRMALGCRVSSRTPVWPYSTTTKPSSSSARPTQSPTTRWNSSRRANWSSMPLSSLSMSMLAKSPKPCIPSTSRTSSAGQPAHPRVDLQDAQREREELDDQRHVEDVGGAPPERRRLPRREPDPDAHRHQCGPEDPGGQGHRADDPARAGHRDRQHGRACQAGADQPEALAEPVEDPGPHDERERQRHRHGGGDPAV